MHLNKQVSLKLLKTLRQIQQFKFIVVVLTVLSTLSICLTSIWNVTWRGRLLLDGLERWSYRQLCVNLEIKSSWVKSSKGDSNGGQVDVVFRFTLTWPGMDKYLNNINIIYFVFKSHKHSLDFVHLVYNKFSINFICKQVLNISK